jgi:hypothetical protein
MPAGLTGNLTGNFLVRALRPAFHDARHWLPGTKDRAELRRHSLKLRFWPERRPTGDNGELLDLDWSWIKALKGERIGELRIHDTLGGHDNLRVIFYDPAIRLPGSLPTIWVLAVLQKKRDDFTHQQIANFKLRKALVLERFYNVN